MNKFPRINIEVDEEFKRIVMMKAISEGMSLREVVTKLLTEWLQNDKS